jgi:valyl-tRNA synthetase
LTLQWFLKWTDLAASALEAVRKGEVKFYPEGMWNMYYQWLQRGQRARLVRQPPALVGAAIPLGTSDMKPTDEDQHVFVAETAEEALDQARKATGKANLSMDDLRQDEDVVDTWFSSWLVADVGIRRL